MEKGKKIEKGKNNGEGKKKKKEKVPVFPGR